MSQHRYSPFEPTTIHHWSGHWTSTDGRNHNIDFGHVSHPDPASPAFEHSLHYTIPSIGGLQYDYVSDMENPDMDPPRTDVLFTIRRGGPPSPQHPQTLWIAHTTDDRLRVQCWELGTVIFHRDDIAPPAAAAPATTPPAASPAT